MNVTQIEGKSLEELIELAEGSEEDWMFWFIVGYLTGKFLIYEPQRELKHELWRAGHAWDRARATELLATI